MQSRIIWPKAGKYVIAVSGGVDSCVLLDILANAAMRKKYELIVAHLDHGIRKDSSEDTKFVKGLAKHYGLEFVSKKIKLGNGASEASGREARYSFLNEVKERHSAMAIITAHHLDDKIETALFNLRRGTGRRGMVPFTRGDILRPLKNIYKAEIITYAKEHKLVWHEDKTNWSMAYSRNVIRNKVIPELEAANPNFKADFVKTMNELEADNEKIDKLLEGKLKNIAKIEKGKIVFERTALIQTSLKTLRELLLFALLKLDPNAEVLTPQLIRLAHFCKTAKPSTTCPVAGGLSATAQKTTIILLCK